MITYEQQGIFGETDLEFAERTAIELIKTFEPVAFQRCPDHGYVVGYSGGKDSDCLVDLFIRSGVKFTVIHNHTTLDIPDTVRYVRKRFAEWTAQGIQCEVHKPKESFWQICIRKKNVAVPHKAFLLRATERISAISFCGLLVWRKTSGEQRSSTKTQQH